MKTLRLEALAGLFGLLLLSWLPAGCAHLDYSRNSAAVYEIVEGSPETFRVSDSKLSRIDVVEPLTERRDGRLFVQVQIVNNRGGSKRIPRKNIRHVSHKRGSRMVARKNLKLA